MPKEIADYLNKIAARIPSIKPGKATIEYLTKIQASTRFWGTDLSLSLNLNFLLCDSLTEDAFPFFFIFLLHCCAGGLLLSVLATTSTILDHNLRRINEGYAIGLTSVLIIVS